VFLLHPTALATLPIDLAPFDVQFPAELIRLTP
jgi:hypothetical protein